MVGRPRYSQGPVLVPGPFPGTGAPVDTPICADRPPLGRACRSRRFGLWHALDAPNEAAQIYKKTGNLRAVQLLLGHTKLENTVRYLGIEVDDALSISEQVEI